MQALTDSETQLLTDLEGIIDKGQKTFVQVGNALSIIKKEQLWRAGYESFDAYLQERWQFKAAYAQHIIRAADTVQSLPNSLATIVATESQARALAKVAPEKRVEVVQAAKAKAEAEGRKVKAQDFVEPPSGGAAENSLARNNADLPQTAPAAPSACAYSLGQFREDVGGLVDLACDEFSQGDLGHVEMDLTIALRKVRARLKEMQVGQLKAA